jgi:phytoene desaturase
MSKAIVIGAGFGGIAAALRLRARGYDVTLIDKQDKLGGRAYQYNRNGFVHDAGPTVITAKFLFDELFELFGKKREDYIEFRDVYPWYRIQFADGSTFDYGGTLEQTLAEIRKIEPRDAEGYLRLLEQTKKIFDIGFVELGDKPFHTIWSMIKCAPDLIRLGNYKTVTQMTNKYIKNEKLRRVFSFQPLLVGGNPFNTTSIYSLIAYLERQWGVQFAMGGTGALVAALGRLMEEVGIEVALNQEVKRIHIFDPKRPDPQVFDLKGIVAAQDQPFGGYYPSASYDGSACLFGVATGEGRTHRYTCADVVVCNADAPHAYMHLIDPKYRHGLAARRLEMPAECHPERTREGSASDDREKTIREYAQDDSKGKRPPSFGGLKYSMGLFVLYFGTRKLYPDIAHHTIVLGKSYKELIYRLFDKFELETEDLSVYLHRPTCTDPSMAPAGCESFYCLVPVPNLQSGIDYEKMGPVLRDATVKYLERTCLPGLSECICEDFYVTPNHFEKNLNTLHGSGFSIQPIFSQSAYFRFHNKAPGIEGLYFVGAGTHPGAGMPGVLCSGRVLEYLLPGENKVKPLASGA